MLPLAVLVLFGHRDSSFRLLAKAQCQHAAAKRAFARPLVNSCKITVTVLGERKVQDQGSIDF